MVVLSLCVYFIFCFIILEDSSEGLEAVQLILEANLAIALTCFVLVKGLAYVKRIRAKKLT